MASWQPMPPGTLLHERYEIEAVSGRGGFGATYRVRDRERFGQLCAVKELLPAQAENPKVRELFEREARTLLSLRHPGIPAFHAFFFRDGRCYLVEDFIDGKTLGQELEDEGPFSEAKVVAIVDELLAILEYLHGRTPAVIHRDIKPANIIRAAAGGLYLVDFGAVKEAMVVASLSPESTIIGTSGYTPPEQLRGLVVPASDLYALGATALNLLVGRSPAELYDVVEGAWRFAGRLGISARVESVLGRLVEEQLARRFQSATAAREALQGRDAAGSATVAISPAPTRPRSTGMPAPGTTVVTAPPVERRAPATWRRWLIAGTAAAVVVVAGAVVALRPFVTGPAPAARPESSAPVVAMSTPPPSAAPAPVPASPPPSAAPAPATATPRAPAAEARPKRDTARVARSEPRPAEAPSEPPRPPAPLEGPPSPAPRPAAPSRTEAPASDRPAASQAPAIAALPPAAPSSLPSRTFGAPVARVWTAAEYALRSLGWEIDTRDFGAGVLVTKSRRLDGDNFGLYAKDTRHRLRVQVKASGDAQSVVTVERVLFRRERIFWVNSDESITAPASSNRQAEDDVLAAIGQGL